ncbi:hypothetical protein OIU78_029053 [Salix suchowensis]|nr:hypothetical protein OIU78_029053 [Salix suchowensis]
MARGSSSSDSRPNPAGAAPQSRREEKRANANSRIDPFVPRTDHNPRELRSWAKRTGFVSTFSSETTSSSNDAATPIPASDLDNKAVENNNNHHRNGGSSPKIEIDPVLGRTKQLNRRIEIEPDSRPGNDDRNPQ